MSTLAYLASTFAWGILLGVLSTVLTLYIISKSTPASKGLITMQGVVLFFFLSFQFSALIGAYKIKKYAEDITKPDKSIEQTQSLHNIRNEYHLFAHFLKGIEIKADGSANATIALLHHIINHYIYRRIGWISGGMIFFFLATLLFAQSSGMKRKQTRRHVRAYNFPHAHRRQI